MRISRFGVPFGLVILALLLHPADAAAASETIAKQWTNACDLPILKQLCDLGGTITSGVNSVASGATQDFFNQLVSWVSGAAAWVLDHVVSMVQSTSAVNLDGAWFKGHYGQMAALSAFVMLPILAIAAAKAAFAGEGGELALAVFFYLPFAIVATFIAVPLVNLVIGSVDWMCNVVSSSLGADYKTFISNVSTAIGGTGSAALIAPFVALLSSLFIVILGLMLIVVLMSRNAMVYITAALIPLALAPMVLPGMGNTAKKLFALLGGAILVKFFIVLSIAIGVAALGAGNTCDPNGASCGTFSTVLAAIAIFCTAIVLPYNMINNFIVLPLFSTPAAISSIIGGAAARRGSPMPMGSSQQIYAGIRHNNSARFAAGVTAPRVPRPSSVTAPQRPPAPSGNPGVANVVGTPTQAGHTGGSLSQMRGNGGNPVRSLFGSRVRSSGSTSATRWFRK